ncbi:FUSC family protein [Streptomyces sp. NPDC051243]|uniref:FUSC family protein n=1 Tax=Streptomyces sp. NPDC051243 TaxID=3365646 RepID=UPI0037B6F85A
MKSAAERTAILHRSVRVTLAAATGFYAFVYGLDEPVLALYALFGPISLGLLAPIPGSGRQRAEVMLKALPVGLLLVALGTALAVQTWAAVLGMLVVGFVLAFAAIAGPRPAGAAPGLQLFYILACFPPYEPQTLWLRLAGLTFGVALLSLCELFLLPQPPAPTYRTTLAEALATAGDTIAGRSALSPKALRETGARLRLSSIPPAERPAGPDRAARGLSQAGSAARRLLEQLARLTETGEFRELLRYGTEGGGGEPGKGPRDTAQGGGERGRGRTDAAQGGGERGGGRTDAAQGGGERGGGRTDAGQGGGERGGGRTDAGQGGGERGRGRTDAAQAGGERGRERTDTASEALLPQVVSLCDETAAALRTGRAVPGPQRMEKAIAHFQQVRLRQATGSADAVPPAPVLRRQAALLAVAESVRILEISVRVGLDGRRTAPIEPRELFWYTQAATPRLWARRITGNMTLRSVQFQNAVRIAVALAAARLVAGSLDLTHGFWVLLAVLTLSRTTVGETWTAIRRAVTGNLVGAVAAGALLIGLGRHTEAYAAILAPAMLIAFTLGPLLGIAWAQGLFTLVVATAFAQIAPASWELAEARIVDVVTGSAIGLLCALLAWPAGARTEVRRTMAGLLRECGPLIKGTVEMLTAVPPGSAPAPPTLPALHRLRLAETAYAQFRSEPGSTAPVRADWHAVLITANHILLGAHWLPRFDLPTTTLPPHTADRVRAEAHRLAETTDRLAAVCGGDRTSLLRTGPTRAAPTAPMPAGRTGRTSGKPTGSMPAEPVSTGPTPAEPVPTGPVLPPAWPVLVDLDMWLRSLAHQLARIEAGLPEAVAGRAGGTTAAGGSGTVSTADTAGSGSVRAGPGR